MMFRFLFKQKTAYEMRIIDWSSDVCSSDLDGGEAVEAETEAPIEKARAASWGQSSTSYCAARSTSPSPAAPWSGTTDRKCAASGRGVSGQLDLGGLRLFKIQLL